MWAGASKLLRYTFDDLSWPLKIESGLMLPHRQACVQHIQQFLTPCTTPNAPPAKLRPPTETSQGDVTNRLAKAVALLHETADGIRPRQGLPRGRAQWHPARLGEQSTGWADGYRRPCTGARLPFQGSAQGVRPGYPGFYDRRAGWPELAPGSCPEEHSALIAWLE